MYSTDKLSEIRFDFLNSGSSSDDIFDLDPVTGVLRTLQEIDRDVMCTNERVCDINIDIQLMPSQYFKIIKIQVTLIDINDNAPMFRDPVIVKTILESSPPNTKLSLPLALDPDGPEFGIKKYALVGGEDMFSLVAGFNPAGVGDIQLTLLSPLDREKQSVYNIQLYAMDGGTPSRNGTLGVEIQVLDVNDNSPSFSKASYDIQVNEDIPVMSTILQVYATDPDDGLNGQVVYGFSSKTETAYGNTFMIDEESGALVVIGELDYEQQVLYTLYVTARDKTPNAVATRVIVTVHVVDLNDHAPEIVIKTPLTDGKIRLPENSQNNSFIAHIGVSDKDAGQNGDYICSLDSPYFSLEEMYVTDYKITAARVFDREVQERYIIVMTCTDKGEDPKSASVELNVAITDENDQSPTFSPSVIHVDLQEDNSLGVRVTTVRAYDFDSGDNADVSYSLVNDLNGIFSIQSDTGIITCNVILDRELTRDLNVTVMATDHGSPPRSGIAVVVVHVTDIDDEIPLFTKDVYEFNVLENQPPGSIVGQVRAVDVDGPLHNMFTYIVQENSEGFMDHFTIDPQTGVIETLDSLDRETTQVHHAMIAAQSNTNIDYVSYSSVKIQVFDLNDNSPKIIFPSKANHTVYIDPLTAQPGQVVAQIQALDIDTAVNSVCEYKGRSDIPEESISIDPYNGSLMVNGDLQWLQAQTIAMDIVVYDCGTPRLSDAKTLVIRFVKEGRGKFSTNAIIVVIISVSTAIIAAILIFLIVHVILKRRKLDRKYNWMARMADHRVKTEDGLREESKDMGSKEAIYPSLESLGELSDVIKQEQKLDTDLDVLSEKRTIEGQETKNSEMEQYHIVSRLCIIPSILHKPITCAFIMEYFAWGLVFIQNM
jgi:hypothetical protein